MTAFCLDILSSSAIQQFELAFEGKLRCDCAKTIRSPFEAFPIIRR